MALPKCFPCTDLSCIVGRPDTPASTAGPCTSPRHDPAPATSCWRLTQPARRSSTEFLKGPWTWAAYAHVLGAQPFQNLLCSAAQKLAPHGVVPMQCRRYGYACTHFAGRDKGFTSLSSFRQCELPGSILERRASLYSHRQTRQLSTAGPLVHKTITNKTKQVPEATLQHCGAQRWHTG